METERGFKEPGFLESEVAPGFCRPEPELKSYAVALGEAADKLSAQDPIPSPASVMEALRGVSLCCCRGMSACPQTSAFARSLSVPRSRRRF